MMKAAIYIASFIVAVALLIDIYFVYLHFFDNQKAKQLTWHYQYHSKTLQKTQL